MCGLDGILGIYGNWGWENTICCEEKDVKYGLGRSNGLVSGEGFTNGETSNRMYQYTVLEPPNTMDEIVDIFQ